MSSAWDAVAGPAKAAADSVMVDTLLRKLNKQWIGKRFIIEGDHPHCGKFAECVGFENTHVGYRPRMRDDDGNEFFVLHVNQLRYYKSRRSEL